jgi:hypothetical protein
MRWSLQASAKNAWATVDDSYRATVQPTTYRL